MLSGLSVPFLHAEDSLAFAGVWRPQPVCHSDWAASIALVAHETSFEHGRLTGSSGDCCMLHPTSRYCSEGTGIC